MEKTKTLKPLMRLPCVALRPLLSDVEKGVALTSLKTFQGRTPGVSEFYSGLKKIARCGSVKEPLREDPPKILRVRFASYSTIFILSFPLFLRLEARLIGHVCRVRGGVAQLAARSSPFCIRCLRDSQCSRLKIFRWIFFLQNLSSFFEV